MGASSKDGPFSKDEETFVVKQFILSKSPIAVKRAFRVKFKSTRTTRALTSIPAHHFSRVYERFQNNGIARRCSNQDTHPEHVKGVDKTNPEKVKIVENHFIEFPMDSLHNASITLDIPTSTLSDILRKKLKMRPYKISLSQTLTEAHKQQRKTFCQWILEQDDETISQIIFRDEKWFQLNQHPNRQNTRYWSVSKPNLTYDVKNQHVSKIMAFVIVVDGQSFVYWHVDSSGKNLSVNSAQYIESVIKVLDDIPLHKLRNYIWQQDGAPSHTSNVTMKFLKGIFKDRIISRLAKIVTMPEWSARSPDLNPLDFTFWSQAMQKVWEEKPKTIAALKTVVETFFSSLTPDFINNCVLNIKTRAQLCVQENGGHFEHLM